MRGFTLPELLIALAISSLLLSGAMRVLPALQANIVQNLVQLTAMRDLEQLAETQAKILRRAGYCAGKCQGKGLIIETASQCLIAVWDENHNGQWENDEFSAYRLREGSLEVHRGARSCQGSGWERISSPQTLQINRWEVTLRQRPGWPPRIEQRFEARAVVKGQMTHRPLRLTFGATGFNL